MAKFTAVGVISEASLPAAIHSFAAFAGVYKTLDAALYMVCENKKVLDVMVRAQAELGVGATPEQILHFPLERSPLESWLGAAKFSGSEIVAVWHPYMWLGLSSWRTLLDAVEPGKPAVVNASWILFPDTDEVFWFSGEAVKESFPWALIAFQKDLPAVETAAKAQGDFAVRLAELVKPVFAANGGDAVIIASAARPQLYSKFREQSLSSKYAASSKVLTEKSGQIIQILDACTWPHGRNKLNIAGWDGGAFTYEPIRSYPDFGIDSQFR